MKIKKKHFKKLKEIAVAVNQILPGTGIRLDKLIAEMESVQKVPVQDLIYAMHRKDVEDNIHKESDAMVAASGNLVKLTRDSKIPVPEQSNPDPKIGDVGYFWDSIKQGVYYGILGTISKFEVFKYIPLGYKGNQFKNFSKTPPELK